MAITLGGLAGVLTYAYARNRFAPRQAQGLGVGILALVAAGIVVGPLLGMGQVPGVVLMSSVAAPTALYVLTVVRGERNRLGLLLPAVVIGGAFLGAFAVQQLGFAGPQSWLDWQFLTSNHRNDPEQAGVYAALAGTIMLMLMVALLSFPLGVGAAVYLEEYAPSNWVTRLIKVNISNLAGVPSVVYGLLGLGLFVNYLDGGLPVVGKAELFNPGTVIIGGITLSLLILPIVIVSSREAIRAVPDSLRQASYGMGATRWQTIRKVVLPRALPGILTGTILALGRAIGETAPLLVIGAPQVFDLPQQLSDPVGAVPLQIFSWATTFASPAFYTTALAAGVVTLLVVLLAMNSVAIVVRNKYQQRN